MNTGNANTTTSPEHDKLEGTEPQRVHQRFALTHPYLASVSFSEKSFGTIRDISYSGLAVLINTTEGLTALGGNLESKLTILGRSIPCQLRLRHKSEKFVGFEFVHTTSEVLIFLRQFLEPLRMGAQFQLQTNSTNKRHVYLDELSNSVEISLNDDGEVVNSKLTLCLHGIIHEVDVTAERTQISSAVTKLGEASIAKFSANADPQVISSAIFLLLGIASQNQSTVFNELIAVLLRQCHVIPFQELSIVG